MDDTPEVIRQQMEETKLQLTEKLETLEHQVSETVASTGTAVNATVEAVQVTVETVTGAVQDAVQSVSNAFDLRRQIERHPFLVLGGSLVLGYLAVEFLTGSPKKTKPRQSNTVPPIPSSNNVDLGNVAQTVEPAAQAAAIAAAYEQGLKSSSWNQLRSVAFGSVVSIIQEVASRAVPQLIDQLTANLAANQTSSSDVTGEQQPVPPTRQEADEEAQHLHIATAERVRSGKSF